MYRMRCDEGRQAQKRWCGTACVSGSQLTVRPLGVGRPSRTPCLRQQERSGGGQPQGVLFGRACYSTAGTQDISRSCCRSCCVSRRARRKINRCWSFAS